MLLGPHLAEASLRQRRCPGRVWVHGIGGLTGSLLAEVFATAAIGGSAGPIEGNLQQLLIQLYGVTATLVWSAGATFVLLKLVGVVVALRVSREHPLEGLDITQQGETLL